MEETVVGKEDTQLNGEDKSFKKKKKFVYLDKFETYKEITDEKIRLMQKSINISYALIGLIVISIIVLGVIK